MANEEKLSCPDAPSKTIVKNSNLEQATSIQDHDCVNKFKSELRTVDQWLGKTLRVELVDGRIILGRFVCTDSVPNIILMDSRGFWMFEEKEADGDLRRLPVRNVGMVLIKGQHIQRIFLAVRDDEAGKKHSGVCQKDVPSEEECTNKGVFEPKLDV